MIYPQPSIQLDAPIDLSTAKICFTEKQLNWVLEKRISGEIMELWTRIKFIGMNTRKHNKMTLINKMVAKIKKMTFDDKLALIPKIIEDDIYLFAILLGEPQYYFKEVLFNDPRRRHIRLIICKRCRQMRIHKSKGLCVHCYGYLKRDKKIKYGIRELTRGAKIICTRCKRLKKNHSAGLCTVCYHRLRRKKVWDKYIELLVIKLLMIVGDNHERNHLKTIKMAKEDDGAR